MRVPDMPRITCPAIDEVQYRIEKAQEKIDEASTFLNGLIRELEDLRDANSQLRQCAEYWQQQSEDQEETIEALNNKIENLEYELREAA